VRAKIHGSEERLRLSVFRSSAHIYAQVINDDLGHTLAAASSRETEIQQRRPEDGANAKVFRATEVGKLLAERARAKGVTKVVFDRAGYLYHGRVKALADGAREGGLDF
jgi:large subunit ribosomal protein L18